MRDSASEFCQRPAMRLGFVLRGGDAGVAVGQLGGAAVAVVDSDDPLDVVQLGGDREKIRTSEAIRPSECPFSTLHCLRPLLKKREFEPSKCELLHTCAQRTALRSNRLNSRSGEDAR